jgi:aquaporin Z
MKKPLVEFIGTFFFVLTIGLSVISAPIESQELAAIAGTLTPIAIGSALMVMIFAGGHISGGHYNPAVTLAVTLRGKCAAGEAPVYMAAQVLGAAAASFAVRQLEGEATMNAIRPMTQSVGPALLAEFLYTFALCWVVLNVATAKGTNGNSFYGLAIGFTVMIGAFTVGNISGGAFNPAVAVGITLLGLSSWGAIWIFLVANFAAAIAAALVFKAVNPPEN